LKYSLPVFGVMLFANLFAREPFGKADFAGNLGAILAGTVLTPALLPYIPGKAFAAKGWLMGLACTAAILGISGKLSKGDKLLSAGHLLLFPAIASFLAINFTGASTYTSPSGVVKEMEKALPFIVGAAVAGMAITLGVHLFGGKERNKNPDMEST